MTLEPIVERALPSSLKQIALQILLLLATDGPLNEEELRKWLAQRGIVKLGPEGDNKFCRIVNFLTEKQAIKISGEGLYQITTSGHKYWKDEASMTEIILAPIVETAHAQAKKLRAIVQTLQGEIEALGTRLAGLQEEIKEAEKIARVLQEIEGQLSELLP